MLATLLVHAIFLSPLVLGPISRKAKVPDSSGAGSDALKSSAEAEITMILVEDTASSTDSSTVQQDLASQGLVASLQKIKMLGPNPELPSDVQEALDSVDEALPTLQSSSDTTGKEVLFGRYMEQIEARIERAWLRPRTRVTPASLVPGEENPAVNEDPDSVFSCRVTIVQDNAGNVGEVVLEQCNGTSDWQQSLVNAIQSASPLPSPATPTVFANRISLNFMANSYRPGGSGEGFTAQGDPSESSDRLAKQSIWVRRDGTLYLTIIGKRSNSHAPALLQGESASDGDSQSASEEMSIEVMPQPVNAMLPPESHTADF